MILYFSIESPYRWARLDRRGRFLNEGIAASLAELPIDKHLTRLVGVVPGDGVTLRQVAMPARARNKALAAAPYALEDGLASDVDDLAFTLVDWKSGGESVIAVVAREQMETWQSALETLSRPVDALIPEYFLLPRHAQAQITLVTNSAGKIVIRSAPDQGLTIDEEALELWWEGIREEDQSLATDSDVLARWFIEHGATRVSKWDVGSHFGVWLQNGQQIPPMANLLQGNYQPKHQKSAGAGLRAAAMLLSLAFLIRVGIDGYDQWRLSRLDRSLDEQIIATFKQAFPDVTRIVNPRLQMEQRLRGLQGGAGADGRFQVLLAAVAEAVPGSNAKLEEVNFRDKALIVICTTRDFAGLDQLKSRFANNQRVRVELLSSGSRDNRVSGRFRLLLAS